jgi:hypothetical protein
MMKNKFLQIQLPNAAKKAEMPAMRSKINPHETRLSFVGIVHKSRAALGWHKLKWL